RDERDLRGRGPRLDRGTTRRRAHHRYRDGQGLPRRSRLMAAPSRGPDGRSSASAGPHPPGHSGRPGRAEQPTTRASQTPAPRARRTKAGARRASRRRLVTPRRGPRRYLVLESRLPAAPTAAIQAPRAPSRLPVDAEPSRQAMILAGPPGAGKSTLRRGPLREETAEHVLRI